jgi:hypothetical protein
VAENASVGLAAVPSGTSNGELKVKSPALKLTVGSVPPPLLNVHTKAEPLPQVVVPISVVSTVNSAPETPIPAPSTSVSSRWALMLLGVPASFCHLTLTALAGAAGVASSKSASVAATPFTLMASPPPAPVLSVILVHSPAVLQVPSLADVDGVVVLLPASVLAIGSRYSIGERGAVGSVSAKRGPAVGQV